RGEALHRQRDTAGTAMGLPAWCGGGLGESRRQARAEFVRRRAGLWAEGAMRWRAGRLAALAGAAALLLAVVPPPAAAAGTIPPTFADPAFRAVWQRYDRPVADGAAVRSWTWGGDVTGALQEPFREGPGGRHL